MQKLFPSLLLAMVLMEAGCGHKPYLSNVKDAHAAYEE